MTGLPLAHLIVAECLRDSPYRDLVDMRRLPLYHFYYIGVNANAGNHSGSTVTVPRPMTDLAGLAHDRVTRVRDATDWPL